MDISFLRFVYSQKLLIINLYLKSYLNQALISANVTFNSEEYFSIGSSLKCIGLVEEDFIYINGNANAKSIIYTLYTTMNGKLLINAKILKNSLLKIQISKNLNPCFSNLLLGGSRHYYFGTTNNPYTSSGSQGVKSEIGRAAKIVNETASGARKISDAVENAKNVKKEAQRTTQDLRKSVNIDENSTKNTYKAFRDSKDPINERDVKKAADDIFNENRSEGKGILHRTSETADDIYSKATDKADSKDKFGDIGKIAKDAFKANINDAKREGRETLDRASSAAQDMKHAASQTLNDALNKASNVAHDVKQKAKQTMQKATQKVSEKVSQLKKGAEEQLQKGKQFIKQKKDQYMGTTEEKNRSDNKMNPNQKKSPQNPNQKH